MDFRNEALNAARCAVNFTSPKSRVRDRVVVPTVYPQLSSSRVLTMEYMEGCGVTDLAALKAAGLSAAEVSFLLSSCPRLYLSTRIAFHHGLRTTPSELIMARAYGLDCRL